MHAYSILPAAMYLYQQKTFLQKGIVVLVKRSQIFTKGYTIYHLHSICSAIRVTYASDHENNVHADGKGGGNKSPVERHSQRSHK